MLNSPLGRSRNRKRPLASTCTRWGAAPAPVSVTIAPGTALVDVLSTTRPTMMPLPVRGGEGAPPARPRPIGIWPGGACWLAVTRAVTDSAAMTTRTAVCRRIRPRVAPYATSHTMPVRGLRMSQSVFRRLLLGTALAVTTTLLLADQPRPAPKLANGVDLTTAKPGRDPNQPLDEEYTKKIKEYTTETFFLSPLVDYLPASKTVPTPKVVLGDIAGAP